MKKIAYIESDCEKGGIVTEYLRFPYTYLTLKLDPIWTTMFYFHLVEIHQSSSLSLPNTFVRKPSLLASFSVACNDYFPLDLIFFIFLGLKIIASGCHKNFCHQIFTIFDENLDIVSLCLGIIHSQSFFK